MLRRQSEKFVSLCSSCDAVACRPAGMWANTLRVLCSGFHSCFDSRTSEHVAAIKCCTKSPPSKRFFVKDFAIITQNSKTIRRYRGGSCLHSVSCWITSHMTESLRAPVSHQSDQHRRVGHKLLWAIVVFGFKQFTLNPLIPLSA